MTKTATVKLGGRDFPITEKVMGETSRWRKKLRASSVMLIFESLDEAIHQVIVIGEAMTSGQKLSDIDLAPVIASARVIPIVVRGLTNSIEEVIELVYDYCPAIAADREWIEAHAYDHEFIDAFLEVLKFNFPITALWDMVRGSRVQSTSTKSPVLNGVSGLPASGPVKKKA